MTSLLLSILLAGATEPPPDPGARAAEAARFAEWLYERGDYYRAIGEWERALFLEPDGRSADRYQLRIARAYAAGGRADASVAALLALRAGARDAAVRDEALFEMGRVRYRAGRAEAAAAALAPYVQLSPPAGGPGAEPARFLLSLAYLRAGDPARARLAVDATAPDGPLAGEAAALREAIRSLNDVPRRSPAAAGVLSAVLPGLGHAYAGDPGGAAGAFALNGLFVWATVDALRDRRHGLAALLLAGESIWYGGAIFGAVAEAMRFNRDARRAALERIDGRFRWAIEPVPGGATLGIRGALDAATPRERSGPAAAP